MHNQKGVMTVNSLLVTVLVVLAIIALLIFIIANIDVSTKG